MVVMLTFISNLDEAVSKAMHRIEEMCNKYNEDELYISYSGGRDSTVILWLCLQCYMLGTIPYLPKAVFSDTGLEMQAIKEFVEEFKKCYPNIITIKPEKSFVYCIKTYGKPMISKLKGQFIKTYQKALKKNNNCFLDLNKVSGNSRIALLIGKSDFEKDGTTSRYRLAKKHLQVLHPDFNIKVADECCHTLKKKPFEKFALENNIKAFMDGEMASEGGIRKSAYEKRLKNGGKGCTSLKEIGEGKNKRTLEKRMPIIDWTEEVEEEYIQKYNVPLSKAYTTYGCKRTGCFLCPYAKSNKDLTERLKVLWDFEPKTYKYALATMKDVYIAQNIELPFDQEYEKERISAQDAYSKMRDEVEQVYHQGLEPKNHKISLKKYYQMSIFDFM